MGRQIRRGAAGMQYAVIVGLIAVLAIAAIAGTGGSIRQMMTKTANTLTVVGNGSAAGATTSGGGGGGAADTTPDPLNIPNVTGASQSGQVQSAAVAITGFDGALTASVNGDGSPQIEIAGSGNWVTSGPITAGQTLRIRLTSASGLSAARNAIVSVGTVSQTWTVTTYASAPTSCGGGTLSGNSCVYTTSGTFSFATAGLSSVRVRAWGAGGGWGIAGHSPGAGGHVDTVLPVNASETLTVTVGGPGGSSDYYSDAAGGFNGGGSSGAAGGGGGGASDVRRGSTRLAVAAGGGGGGYYYSGGPGGAGGGAVGEAAPDNANSGGGQGGTQSAGGALGFCINDCGLLGSGTAGSSGQGGKGDYRWNGAPWYGECCNGGGGGGGGWYGGGGGTPLRGGGGGSSYPPAGAVGGTGGTPGGADNGRIAPAGEPANAGMIILSW